MVLASDPALSLSHFGAPPPPLAVPLQQVDRLVLQCTSQQQKSCSQRKQGPVATAAPTEARGMWWSAFATRTYTTTHARHMHARSKEKRAREKEKRKNATRVGAASHRAGVARAKPVRQRTCPILDGCVVSSAKTSPIT